MIPEMARAFADEMQKIAASKGKACMYCSEPSEKDVVWADGRACIPVCNSHVAKARHQVEVKNKDEVAVIRTAKWIRKEREKQAGVLNDVGNRIGQGGQWVAKHWRGTTSNVGETIKAFGTPVSALKRGARMTVDSFKGRSNPGMPAMGMGGKALFVGFTGKGIYDVAKKDDPLGRGRSRIHRAAEFAGNQAGGLIAAPFGLSGQILGSTVGSKVGDTAGRVADRLRHFKPKVAPIQRKATDASGANV